MVSGLTNGDRYTFTVRATNTAGAGISSSPSTAVVPDPPRAATAITATAGNAQASVAFTVPASDGGSAITSYTVTARDSTSGNGGETATGSSSPVVVTGLTNGDRYTFTVTATNGAGTGSGLITVQRGGAGNRPGCPDRRHRQGGKRRGECDVHRSDVRRGLGHHLLHGDGPRLDAPGQGGQTVTGPSSPLVVTGLTNGDSFTFTVQAINGAGAGRRRCRPTR